MTPWAETVHFSRLKVVPAGLKSYSCLSNSRYVRPPSHERDKWSSCVRANFGLLDFQEDLVDRLRGVEGKSHRLLTRFPSDPASASPSPIEVEGKINGMVGSLGSHQHGGNGSDVDLARGGVRGCRGVA